MKTYSFIDSKISQFIFFNTKMAWFWLVVRLYVGYQWLIAGYEKITSPAWVGGNAGEALIGFIKGALAKTLGSHPDVSAWYAWFLQHAVLPYVYVWSHAVAYGEFFVGVGLILGAFTALASFFGLFMNLNYLLAGTVSTNPILFTLGILLFLAQKVSGYYGLDFYINQQCNKFK